MEIKNFRNKITGVVKKYRYPLIVLMIGILLMLLPAKRTKTNETPAKIPQQAEKNVSTEEKLETILSKIHGAGEVTVLLTTSSGEESIYQVDSNTGGSQDAPTGQITTVIVTDAERQQTGLVRKTIPEQYLGAIIVCEGADSPTVRLSIVEAVSKVTGLGADHISVLKMK